MTILVTGGNGQVGRHLAAHAGVIALGRDDLDICDPASVSTALDRHHPDAVIHTAAFTHVDDCDRDPARAFRVNAGGTEIVAAACSDRGIRLLHLSTDYVLNGPDTAGHRLLPEAVPAPLSTYGRSKWAAERAIHAHGGHIVRVQWVYSIDGTGFVNRAIARMRRGEPVSLVTDQVGSPTPAPLLAQWLIALTHHASLPRVIHLAAQGEATPAQWVSELARAQGVAPVWQPMKQAELPGALRPARSCLDVAASEALLQMRFPHWRPALLEMFRLDHQISDSIRAKA